MDQLDISSDGTKLYVPEPGVLSVYSALTGAPISGITDPSIVTPLGVCVR